MVITVARRAAICLSAAGVYRVVPLLAVRNTYTFENDKNLFSRQAVCRS